MSYIRLKYLPRKLLLRVYPATVVFNNRPAPGKGPSTRLTPEWLEFIRGLNPSLKAFHTIIGKSRGWVNRAPEGDKVQAESVSMGGNIAEVLEVQRKFVRVAALCVEDGPPEPADVNFQDVPWLVHKFTCLGPRGAPALPADGVEAYFPFVFSSRQVWVARDAVDLFDEMPDPLVPLKYVPGGFPAIAIRGAVVRQSPDGVKIEKLKSDTRINVMLEVRGWAKIAEQRWIAVSSIRRAGETLRSSEESEEPMAESTEESGE